MLSDHLCKVDGSKVAGFICKKRLLTAGVCGLDGAELWCRVVAVDLVEKEDTRFTILPGALNNKIEDLPRPDIFYRSTAAWVDKRKRKVFLHCIHEDIGHTHGKIEAGEPVRVALNRDEFLDVGVIHPQNTHVCTA